MSGFSLSNNFIDELSNVSGSGIKIFLVLKELASHEKQNGDVWVNCSYGELMKKTGIEHKQTIRLGIIDLAKIGWITNFKRGYYDRKTESKKSNSYLVPEEPAEDPSKFIHEEWFGKLMNWGKDE